MATDFIPSLGDVTILDYPDDMITETLRMYCYAPKNQSEIFKQWTVSLSDTLSRNAGKRQAMATAIETELTSLFTRIFPTGDVTVIVDTQTITEVLYSIVITVTVVINGQAHTLSPSVQINNGVIVTPYDTIRGV